MKSCNIVFMGTPDIAVAMLNRLLEDGYHVIAVVTQPDKKIGRKRELHMPEVKQRAIEATIPVYQPTRIQEAMDDLMKLPIDLIVTCAYGQFIPSVLLDFPTYGSINVHASLLPKLRGGAPIHKAIINGDQQTGMSIMRMVKKMDAGAIMSQCVVPIHDEDTTGDLYDRLSVAGATLLSASIPKVIDGSAVFQEQVEAEATFAYTICKEEEFINFHQPTQVVYNHIRGLLPFPVGYSIIEGKKIKFHKVRKLMETPREAPGVVVGLKDQGFAIACLDGYVLLDELQMEGKAKSDAKSFYNGAGRSLINKCFAERDSD